MDNDNKTSWYLIFGLSPLLDGLMVECSQQQTFSGLSVLKVVDRSFMLGDRDISYNFPDNSFIISQNYLKPIDNPTLREYVVSNPWGKLLKESVVELDNLKANMTTFEKCMQVSVVEKQDDNKTKTLYSNYFFKELETVEKFIQYYPKETAEMLILDLQELKSKENNEELV